ncbi:Ger(x)C family spore germination protein [Paenibacillus chartarius]|uniref:Ger(X)C family spore germination protein n=1 Tax=Paenibacillus chartarius TaxID=747481 RepID=A0ABV6DH57_9BACL
MQAAAAKIILSFFAVLTMLLVTGCWDRREINDVALVSGSAIDKKGNQYTVLSQIPLPSQIGGAGSKGGGGGTNGKQSWYNDSATADSLRRVIEDMQRTVSRELYFAHRRIVVFGEEMARSGLEPVMDASIRLPQNRLSSLAAVTKGEAGALFNVRAPMEQLPSEMMRELVQNATRTPYTLKRLNQEILRDGLDPAIPFIRVHQTTEVSGKTTTLELAGVGVLKKGSLVGYLESDEASYLWWAMGEANNPVVQVEAPESGGSISLLFQEVHADLVPQFTDDQISVVIRIDAKGAVVENESNYDLTADERMETTVQLAENKIKAGIERTVKKLQSLHSDPIGIGDVIYRKNDKKWSALRDKWNDQEYPKVQVSVETNLYIEHSGSIREPFGYPEGEITR